MATAKTAPLVQDAQALRVVNHWAELFLRKSNAM